MNIDNIWGEYRTAVKAFLHSKVSDADDVDDILQEVLIKTYNNLQTINNSGSIKPWLLQVARNATIDYYRKKGNFADIQIEDLWHEDDSLETQHALSPCVAPFLKALPQQSADLLTAIDLQGRSQKEYAQEAGISYSTLKSRVQSSRKLLRELFSECCNFSFDSQGNIADYQSKSGCDCPTKP